LNKLRKRTKKLIRFDNKLRDAYGRCICGVDEAGRGPLAGPVIAAAVIIDENTYIDGVFDSKQLNEEQRNDLYVEIKNKCISFGLGIVRHIDIDRINILNATKLAMKKAIEHLRLGIDAVLVDGNFYQHDGLTVVNIIKGDTLSFSIAAASIIAKVTRDRLMEKYENLFPAFSFGKHKGYPTKQHIDEILKNGYTDIHRRTFKLKCLDEPLSLFD
jgi:ribonuclease HII